MTGEVFVAGLSLKATLYSGQAFRWVPVEDGYAGVVAGRLAFLNQEDDGALVSCSPGDEDFWRRYFACDADWDGLALRWAEDPLAGPALAASAGLRVLRQPFWETVVAFILSQNNNDARIRACVARVCQAAGRAHPWCETVLYDIPKPEALLSLGEDRLRKLGVGYRAPYLIAAAQWMLASGTTVVSLPYPEAHAALTAVRGIGDKVADCVALFGLGHTEAFPVDVWIERALAPHFPGAKGRIRLAEAAQGRWGRDAGLVQQALFCHARAQGSAAHPVERIRGKGTKSQGGLLC